MQSALSVPRVKPPYGDAAVGCWFDGCRGHYIGEAIIQEAMAHGFQLDSETITEVEAAGRYADIDLYHELTDEAERWMDQFAADGYWFGYNEHSGDWGLWESEED